MKKPLTFYSFLLLIFLSSTALDPVWRDYEPVFMLRSEMEKNVKLELPRKISDAGKIYLKDHLIFINEKYRGIHVIDNSDPENPKNIAFVNVDGCIDMAMKGNVLYADNSVDLIALRFDENVNNIEVTKRIRDVFPEPLAPSGRGLNWKEQLAVPEGAILVRWNKNN